MSIKEKIKDIIRVHGYLMLIRRILCMPLLLVAFLVIVFAASLWSITMLCEGDYREARKYWNYVF